MSVPTVFGRAMVPSEDGSVHSLELGEFTFHVGTQGRLAQIELNGRIIFHESDPGTTESLERRARELVLMLAELALGEDDDEEDFGRWLAGPGSRRGGVSLGDAFMAGLATARAQATGETGCQDDEEDP